MGDNNPLEGMTSENEYSADETLVDRRNILKATGVLTGASLIGDPAIAKKNHNKPPAHTQKWDSGSVINVNPNDTVNEIVEKAANVSPTSRQQAWKKLERTAFLHFGVNTFTGREWGTGLEDPDVFHPTNFNPTQWMEALKAGGFKSAILTVKHHDGFCLYPSDYTDFDVASSTWRDGQGDVVREVADAAREAGLKFGFYLSPADLHEIKTPAGRYGNGSEARPTEIPTPVNEGGSTSDQRFTYTLDDYNRYFMNQLYEVITRYGPVNEVWFDGANPKPGIDQNYNEKAWYDLVRKLQPSAVIAVGGPDARWVGNEEGIARESEWSPLPFQNENPTFRHEGISQTATDLGSREQLAQNPEYLAWYPAEADTSIRPGWFYHPDEDDDVMTVDQMVDIYYKSVGRNANLLLNVPPDRRGLLHETDVARLAAFGERIHKAFDTNLAVRGHGRGAGPPPRAGPPEHAGPPENAGPPSHAGPPEHAGPPTEREHNVTVEASSTAPGHAAANAIDGTTDTYWMADSSETTATLTFDLGDRRVFNRVSLQEYTEIGQRIESFALDIWKGSSWKEITSATTVGYKRLLRFDTVEAQRVRLRIEQSRTNPTLASFGLYLDPHPPILEASSDSATLIPDQPVTVSASFVNASNKAAEDVHLTLSAPEELNTKALTPTSVESVVQGESVTAQWKVSTSNGSVTAGTIDTLTAAAEFIYDGASEQTRDTIDVITAPAGEAKTQLLVDFNGSFNSEMDYAPTNNEIINGQLDRKSGHEEISNGVVNINGGTTGLVFTPAESLDDGTYLDTSVVAEVRVRAEDAQELFATLIGIVGNTWVRHENGELVYGFTGPASTDYAETRGTVETPSTSEFVDIALVYTYVSDSTACITLWKDERLVGRLQTNTTAASAITDTVGFGCDVHPAADKRGYEGAFDAIALSTFTGGFRPSYLQLTNS